MSTAKHLLNNGTGINFTNVSETNYTSAAAEYFQ